MTFDPIPSPLEMHVAGHDKCPQIVERRHRTSYAAHQYSPLIARSIEIQLRRELKGN